MIYLDTYESPVGTLTLASDGLHLCGLWMDGQKYFEDKLELRLGIGKSTANGNAATSSNAAPNSGAIDTNDISFAGEARLEGTTPDRLEGIAAREASPALQAGRTWLDTYFTGHDPGPLPPYRLHGTPFQEQVWGQIARIPYGKLTTYGAIAQAIGPLRPSGHASARAVGVAVGRNPLSIIVPCHRVVGSNGSLTGYAGGIERKVWLLEHEGVDLSGLHRPTRGTAL